MVVVGEQPLATGLVKGHVVLSDTNIAGMPSRTDLPDAVAAQAADGWPLAPQQRTEPGRTVTAGGAQPLALAWVYVPAYVALPLTVSSTSTCAWNAGLGWTCREAGAALSGKRGV